ncbi:hypothetical protein BDV98DRAFT_562748 [Pterulicium gracile]|uniref:Uncharacterized protein n=1 Tax=Pterulicium gracile TaxID=1884261 RepID=A0A5C3QRZ4_9AGAR|nr:hypothetical protein BDV98DRAFT_562748 [Pterula gracilis]
MTQGYIVVYKDSADDAEIQKHIDSIESKGGKIGTKHTLIKGYSASIPDSFIQELQSLQSADGIIESIEPDQTVTTQ